MRKVIVVAFVAVVLIMFMGVVSAVTILDHAMCKDIDKDEFGTPINLTTIFSTSDVIALSWVKFKDMKHGDTLKWEWIQPNGSEYSASSSYSKCFVMVDGPSRCAYYMYIANNPPANIPGNWHVNIYFNDEKKFTETFAILAPTPEPTPTVTPTSTPSPTPTPEEGVPGFEAIFAIAGLLAVTYLLKRRK